MIMDIEAFSDDKFDAANWINAAFKNSDQQNQNKEAFVSTVVSKLQLYVQQLNSALEDTSQQVLAGMPRIMKDAQNLQTEALSLRAKMSEVQNDITQVQRETGACMEHLERLDSLKTKLQNSKQGLLESDGWGRLTSELEDLLERSDLLNARDKLQSLQKSLAAQTGLAGQSERDAQVEGFKNRMEALASPGVVQSFTTGDIEKSKKNVETFQIMERLPQLTQYYRTVQKSVLQQQWTEIVELAIQSSSPRFVREFYDFLLENWQRQHKWCSTVFGSVGVTEPTLVLIELLPALEPARDQAVNNYVKRNNDEKLAILQEVSSANIAFGKAMMRALRDIGGTEALRRLARPLATSIFDWFVTFVAQYAAMEQNHLATQLAELQLVHGKATESVRALGNSNAKVFEWGEEAIGRCEMITQNCGLPALVIVFNNIFKTFLEKYKKAQQQLHASRSTEQDWSLLQTCIALLHNIGDFTTQLSEFEKRFVQLVLQKKQQIDGQDDTYAGYRVVGNRELKEFESLYETVTSTSGIELEGIFKVAYGQVKPICEYIHDTTLSTVFAPIEIHLKCVQPVEGMLSGGGDLPDYSFAPQEFITQVGQYLLTLPQHLEPLLLAPSAQLQVALELSDERYARNIPSADVLLSLLVEETCAMYEEQISQICELSTSGAKQLATNIEYLGSVLEELGLGLSVHLQQTASLLRAPADQYLTQSAGFDPKLVTGIRQMRNIVSME